MKHGLEANDRESELPEVPSLHISALITMPTCPQYPISGSTNQTREQTRVLFFHRLGRDECHYGTANRRRAVIPIRRPSDLVVQYLRAFKYKYFPILVLSLFSVLLLYLSLSIVFCFITGHHSRNLKPQPRAWMSKVTLAHKERTTWSLTL